MIRSHGSHATVSFDISDSSNSETSFVFGAALISFVTGSNSFVNVYATVRNDYAKDFLPSNETIFQA